MVYLTKLIHISRKQDLLRIIGVNLNNVFVQKEAIFNLELLTDNIELEYIRSEVHSSTNKLVTSEITVNKYGGTGKFVPIESGLHELKIFYKDNLATKPLKIKVHPDLTNVIFSGIEPCSVGSLVEVVVSFSFVYYDFKLIFNQNNLYFFRSIQMVPVHPMLK